MTLVVISHGSAQLLVVHVDVILLAAPQLGHAVAVHEAERALVIVLPADQTGIVHGGSAASLG